MDKFSKVTGLVASLDRGVSILLSRRTFGCGSSGQLAPWALRQDGFHVIAAAGFCRNFKGNYYKKGLLRATARRRWDSVIVRPERNLMPFNQHLTMRGKSPVLCFIFAL